MAANRPEAVFVAAARVGGILANDTYPADFLYDNLAVEMNLIEAAHAQGVEKLLFLGSSCIYPRLAPQPIPEDALMAGPLEPTNEAYAIAKIAGIKLAQAYRRQHGRDFISRHADQFLRSRRQFRPRDQPRPSGFASQGPCREDRGHGRFEIWGSGEPRREFLHSDDSADACVFLMKAYSDVEPVNVGSQEDIKVADLARLVCEIVGIEPEFVYDRSKPDGVPQKLMDSGKIRALGWRPRITLEAGIRAVYADLIREGGAFR